MKRYDDTSCAVETDSMGNPIGCEVFTGRGWTHDKTRLSNRQKPQQFFANNRAIIRGLGSESEYLIDGALHSLHDFTRFIEGKSLKDGRNRHDRLSKAMEKDLYYEELRYFISDSAGEINHSHPQDRLREELLADVSRSKKAKAKALKRKTEMLALDAEEASLKRMYNEVRLEVLEEKLAKMEHRKAEILAEKKYHKENYNSYGLRG